MKLEKAGWTGLLSLCVVLLTGVAHAAPVPVADIKTSPGFGPEAVETNGQTLVYIHTAAGWYVPTGAVCTVCTGSGSSKAGTQEELPEPASTVAALTGLKYTQVVLNFGTSGAKFSLGVTITNDDVGVVLGEVGTTSQTTGDTINVYPTTNGVRVGNWVRTITSADYGRMSSYPWHVKYGTTPTEQDLQGFLTTFRSSDFTNDTGTLTFDGIELSGNSGYDPNIVAIIGGSVKLYAPEISHVLPVTGMTFSPSFVNNPETNGQTLTGLATSEGTFRAPTGLTCTAVSSQQAIGRATGEPGPASTNEALSGLRFTQFAVNAGTVTWSLGHSISQTDTKVRFFFGEVALTDQSAGDPVTIWPLSGGQRVGDWALSIRTNDYGAATSPIWHSTFALYDFKGYLVSFAITDFTNGLVGTLTGVDSFRVDCGLNADPNVFGTYELPPLGTLIRVQ